MFIQRPLAFLSQHDHPLPTLLAGLQTQVPCFAWETRAALTALDAQPHMQVLAFAPREVLTVREGQVLHHRLRDAQGQPLSQPEVLAVVHEDPLGYLAQQLQRHPLPYRADLPGFYGGYAGFYGYDMVQYEEPVTFSAPDDGFPDACFYLFDQVLVGQAGQWTLFVHDDPESTLGTAERAEQCAAQLAALFQSAAVAKHALQHVIPEPLGTSAVQRQLGEARFCAEVARLQAAIQAGDIFQAVLSERFQTLTPLDPLTVYQRLHTLNPSPYHFYLHLPELCLLGASPEMLVRRQGSQVLTHPIAGTRPRGQTPAQDAAQRAELLACAKEQAEHLMLVDLARNDLGRVARPGSVQVSHFQEVVNFSHVMHLVSEVQGEVSPSLSGLEVLRACFPAGTLSGAPKVRAMQYLAAQEPSRRKWYGGAVFCLGFDQQLDACIAIRSLCFSPAQAATDTAGPPLYPVTWQAGAGIVADSQPAFEYAEVCQKAQVMQGVLQCSSF